VSGYVSIAKNQTCFVTYGLKKGKDLIKEEKTHMDQNEGEDSVEAKLNNKRMIMGTLKFVI
jgi:hypothetical protein